MWSQSQATVRARDPTSQVRKCVSTDCHCVREPEMNNLKEGKVPFDSQLQGFPFTGTRFCCFGLVLNQIWQGVCGRPKLLSSLWLIVTERSQRATTSRFCLPWTSFLPLGCISYRLHHFSAATTDQQPKC